MLSRGGAYQCRTIDESLLGHRVEVGATVARRTRVMRPSDGRRLVEMGIPQGMMGRRATAMGPKACTTSAATSPPSGTARREAASGAVTKTPLQAL